MRTHQRGFTLVELSLVVVIVGVLSTIAAVGYRKVVASRRMTEGLNVVAGIVKAQEARRSEVGMYVDISGTSPCWYPKDPGPYVTAWGGACTCCARQWTQLAFTPSAPVAFGYSATAGLHEGSAAPDPGPTPTPDPGVFTPGIRGGLGPPPTDPNAVFNGGGDRITLPDTPATSTGPWFIVAAEADFDGDPSRMSKILYDSDFRVMVTANDGE
jgi:prepilin-type N-terminal cleavage/methylation domain-containing protein